MIKFPLYIEPPKTEGPITSMLSAHLSLLWSFSSTVQHFP